jgi:hypothetical protein
VAISVEIGQGDPRARVFPRHPVRDRHEVASHLRPFGCAIPS